MRVLYLGDIMGSFGRDLIERELPTLRKELQLDFVVAQAENLTDGKGVSQADFKRLLAAGADACTGGNWTLHNADIVNYLNDETQPIVRPANYPTGTPGLGYKYVNTTDGKVLIISLLGSIVGRDSAKPTDNALKVVDDILKTEADTPKVAVVINLHGDYSSEKVVIGQYLDGRASMVVGDHWHVPTADAQVLPGGTAHITDVGMCGSLDSSLGVKISSIIPRWRDSKPTPNVLETTGRGQINGLLVEINPATQLATSASHFRRIYP